MPNGIYTNSQTTETQTGAANTDTPLIAGGGWNVLAGGLAADNCLIWRAEFDGTGTASFQIEGVDILLDPWAIYGIQVIAQLEVWRDSNTTALVRPWFGQGGGNEALIPGGRFNVSGLNWQQGQTFQIVGTSTTAGGLALQRAGIIR